MRPLGFDLFDDNSLGAASLIDLASHNDLVSGERKKLGILSA